MTKHETTVEVLTAEVRVLMVGSRQITLSVVRQLDHADPGEIQPFGRVRTDRDSTLASAGIEQIEVVGSAGGVLARSSASRDGHWCEGRPPSLAASVIARLCPDRRAELGSLIPVLRASGAIRSAEGVQEDLREHGPGALRRPADLTVILAAAGDHAAHRWYDSHHPSQAIYDAWSGLPLIVLAGLR
jgi:hypothetical protein